PFVERRARQLETPTKERARPRNDRERERAPRRVRAGVGVDPTQLVSHTGLEARLGTPAREVCPWEGRRLGDERSPRRRQPKGGGGTGRGRRGSGLGWN